MKLVKSLFILVLVALSIAGAFIGSGLYNVAADDPHWSLTYWAMDTLRDRSVRVRSVDLDAPPLGDERMIRSGAGNYDAMCAGCHLSPGAADTELSVGLYPAPPTWSELAATDPRDAFWVIKHGIKMSGMPAWGKSMEDSYIWGMVALLQRFPNMTPAQYKELVAASSGHSHGGGETTRPDTHGRDAHQSSDDAAAPARSSFEPVDDPMLEAPAANDTEKTQHDAHGH